MVRLRSWILGNGEYLFITITLKSTLIRISSTCLGPIYDSNRTVQSFTNEYHYELFEIIQLYTNCLF